MKRQAVDAVHYSGTIGLPFTLEVVGRDPSQNSRLGRVRVNDVRLQTLKNSLDLEIRRDVVNRIDSAAHTIDDDNLIALVLRLVEQFAFWTESRPCDQSDIVTTLSEQATRDQGILLSATQY